MRKLIPRDDTTQQVINLGITPALLNSKSYNLGYVWMIWSFGSKVKKILLLEPTILFTLYFTTLITHIILPNVF